MEYAKVELADLFSSYLSPSTEGYQELITRKKEFHIPDAAKYETTPSTNKSTFFRHQLITHRVLRSQDRLLILDVTGSGKTGSVAKFFEDALEEARKEKEGKPADETIASYNSVIVVVSKLQEEDFKKQLICKFSNGKYETQAVKDAVNETTQKSQITSTLKSAGYKFVTRDKFASELAEKTEDEWIKEYSGSIIFMDEIHRIISQSEPKRERNAPGPSVVQVKNEPAPYSFFYDELEEMDFEDKIRIDNEINGIQNPYVQPQLLQMPKRAVRQNKNEIYDTIHRFLHVVPQLKAFGASATPMINSVENLSEVLNLFLPLDGRMPIDYDYANISPKDRLVRFRNYQGNDHAGLSKHFIGQIKPGYVTNINNMSSLLNYIAPVYPPSNALLDTLRPIDFLEPFLRGLITFVKQTETNIDVVNMGVPYVLDGKPTSLVLLPILPGTAQYNRIQQEGFSFSNFGSTTAPLMNFSYPNGLNTTNYHKMFSTTASLQTGYEKLIISHNAHPQGQLLEIMQSDEKLRDHSVKCSYICELMKRSLQDPYSGVIYIFSPIRVYAGIVAILHSIKENIDQWFIANQDSRRVEIYDPTLSAFTTANSTKSYCSGQSRGTINIEKGVRICVLSANSSSDNIMELIGADENWHGEYLKVIILSRVGQEGINIGNGTDCVIYDAEYNYSNEYQVFSRIMRQTSHNFMRKKLVEMTGNPEAKPRVRIHRLVSFVEHRGNAYVDELYNWYNNLYSFDVPFNIPSLLSSDFIRYASENSIDFKNYIDSRSKQAPIDEKMKMAMQVSITCNIHYKRNNGEADVVNKKILDTEYNAGNINGKGLISTQYNRAEYNPTSDKYLCYNHLPIEFVFEHPEFIDYSTYDVYFSDAIIDEIIEDIFIIYRQRNIKTFSELYDDLLGASYMKDADTRDHRRKMILLAIDKIINNKFPIIDRFGFTCYLRENGGVFYLDRQYPYANESNYLDSYYSDGFIVSTKLMLSDITNVIDDTSTEYNRLATMFNANPLTAKFYDSLMAHKSDPTNRSKCIEFIECKTKFGGILSGTSSNPISRNDVMAMIEGALLRIHTGSQENKIFNEVITYMYRDVIFEIYEPSAYYGVINDRLAEIKGSVGGVGRPRTAISELKPDDIVKIKTTYYNAGLMPKNPKRNLIVNIYESVVKMSTSKNPNYTNYKNVVGQVRVLDLDNLSDGWISVGLPNSPKYSNEYYALAFKFLLQDELEFRINNRMQKIYKQASMAFGPGSYFSEKTPNANMYSYGNFGPIYGYELASEFKIIDIYNGEVVSNDRRDQHRGLACTSGSITLPYLLWCIFRITGGNLLTLSVDEFVASVGVNGVEAMRSYMASKLLNDDNSALTKVKNISVDQRGFYTVDVVNHHHYFFKCLDSLSKKKDNYCTIIKNELIVRDMLIFDIL